MDYFSFAVCFVSGAIWGSFLNVLIYRLPRKLSIATPRSFCPSCKASLEWYENIPLISYLVLRGKCGHCGAGYSVRYFLIEVFTGLFFVGAYFYSQNFYHFLFIVLVGSSLLAISMIDFEFYYVPDSLLLIASIAGIIYISFTNGYWVYLNFIHAFIVFVMFYLLRFVSLKVYKKEAFGFGDVKLATLFGFLLGWLHALIAIFFGFVIAAIFIIVMFLSKKIDKKSYLPFAPYMTAGLFVYSLWGNEIIHWYLHTFLSQN